jgi:hypothetical protein
VCLAEEGAQEFSSAEIFAQIGKMREDSKGRNSFWPLLTIFAIEKWRSKKSLDKVFIKFKNIRFYTINHHFLVVFPSFTLTQRY